VSSESNRSSLWKIDLMEEFYPGTVGDLGVDSSSQ
jgi:hypothetical protein